jgi:hypothetical protein
MKLSRKIMKQAERLDEKQTQGHRLNRKERRILEAVLAKATEEEE